MSILTKSMLASVILLAQSAYADELITINIPLKLSSIQTEVDLIDVRVRLDTGEQFKHLNKQYPVSGAMRTKDGELLTATIVAGPGEEIDISTSQAASASSVNVHIWLCNADLSSCGRAVQGDGGLNHMVKQITWNDESREF